jgi:para-aminobenzoate synthetase component 1
VTVELGSLAELEPALAEEDFDVARVFVGYGASAPSSPEPCRLPKVAYSLERPAEPSGSFRTGDWNETWSPGDYAAAIETVREAIHEGDVYQVNLVQHMWADFAGDPLALAAALAPLRPLEPAPLQGEGWTIVSASPELLLQKRGRVVRTAPIKGTRPAGVPIESAST